MGQYGELREKLLHKETEEADHRRRGKKWENRKRRGTSKVVSKRKLKKMLLAAIAVRILGLSNVSL